MRPVLVAALLAMIGCGDDAPADLDASVRGATSFAGFAEPVCSVIFCA